MPHKVKCHGCGELLYQGEELKTPEEIHQIWDGKCPKCGKKLSLIPQNVEVDSVRK